MDQYFSWEKKTMLDSRPDRVWAVAEAKARLSKILRRAEVEGPQHIGVRRSFVVVPAVTWHAKTHFRILSASG